MRVTQQEMKEMLALRSLLVCRILSLEEALSLNPVKKAFLQLPYVQSLLIVGDLKMADIIRQTDTKLNNFILGAKKFWEHYKDQYIGMEESTIRELINLLRLLLGGEGDYGMTWDAFLALCPNEQEKILDPDLMTLVAKKKLTLQKLMVLSEDELNRLSFYSPYTACPRLISLRERFGVNYLAQYVAEDFLSLEELVTCNPQQLALLSKYPSLFKLVQLGYISMSKVLALPENTESDLYRLLEKYDEFAHRQSLWQVIDRIYHHEKKASSFEAITARLHKVFEIDWGVYTVEIFSFLYSGQLKLDDAVRLQSKEEGILLCNLYLTFRKKAISSIIPDFVAFIQSHDHHYFALKEDKIAQAFEDDQITLDEVLTLKEEHVALIRQCGIALILRCRTAVRESLVVLCEQLLQYSEQVRARFNSDYYIEQLILEGKLSINQLVLLTELQYQCLKQYGNSIHAGQYTVEEVCDDKFKPKSEPHATYSRSSNTMPAREKMQGEADYTARAYQQLMLLLEVGNTMHWFLTAVIERRVQLHLVIQHKGPFDISNEHQKQLPDWLSPDCWVPIGEQGPSCVYVYEVLGTRGEKISVSLSTAVLTYLFDYLLPFRLSDHAPQNNYDQQYASGAVAMVNEIQPSRWADEKVVPLSIGVGFYLGERSLAAMPKSDQAGPAQATLTLGEKSYSLTALFEAVCESCPELYYGMLGEVISDGAEIIPARKDHRYDDIKQRISERQAVLEQAYVAKKSWQPGFQFGDGSRGVCGIDSDGNAPSKK